MNSRAWGEPAQTQQRQAQGESQRKSGCNQRKTGRKAGTCSYSLLLTLKPSHVRVLDTHVQGEKAVAYPRTPGLEVRQAMQNRNTAKKIKTQQV